jgi:hypothetical protein
VYSLDNEDGALGLHRASLKQRLLGRHQMSERREYLLDGGIQGTVEDNPKGSLCIVFADEHHGMAEVRVVQTAAGDE